MEEEENLEPASGILPCNLSGGINQLTRSYSTAWLTMYLLQCVMESMIELGKL